MKIELQRATIENADEIYNMQIESFKTLLEKYKDYETNPGAESIEKVKGRLKQELTHFYIIKKDEQSVGAIRIYQKDYGRICRISPLFILPEYQNKGIAQKVFGIIEDKYKPEKGWELDTILEEKGNCHLYEKMGYKRTGGYKIINERMIIVYYIKEA